MDKNKKNKKNKKNNFGHKYKLRIISIIIIAIISHVVIYILFANGLLLGPGAELEKKDLLAFLSGYLGCVGSLVVGCIAICQDGFFAEEERRRRKMSIQPILSVRIIDEKDEKNDGERSKTLSEGGNILYELSVIEIKNVGKYPCLNLIALFMGENNEVFSKKGNIDLLEPNEKKRFLLVYPREVLSEKHPLNETLNIQDGDITVGLDESQYKLTKACLPKQLDIRYKDIYGDSEYQKFELKDPFGSSMYYSLKEHSVYDMK